MHQRLLAIGLLAACVLLAVSGCLPASASVGERIYREGVGHDGPVTRSTGGDPFTTGPVCENCHGENGEGNVGPAINRETLGKRHSIKHQGQKKPAPEGPWTTEQTVDVARTGITPEGVILSRVMPRWHLDNQDADELAQFLGMLN